MVSRCWHATISPGIIVDSSVIEVTDASILLNFYGCSLVQSGVAQLEDPVERSGEFMLLGESFESDQLRRCLWHICTRDEEDKRRLYCDANIEIRLFLIGKPKI
ncbi:putative von Willebrand factor, type A [Rosa chinensis]|uniref:Protein transport protein SEC23 n=1 Tax=Rosa chinensis TaxID=74649 RepID=A0A2P6QQ47_ROSCH|nr:putative von Willebrand factor, type A [Rosa chinensis]